MKISKGLRKKILDLKYNEYLQYLNTSLVIGFTFIVGLIVTILTQNINLIFLKAALLALISTVIVGTIGVFSLIFKRHMVKITKEIRNPEKD